MIDYSEKLRYLVIGIKEAFPHFIVTASDHTNHQIWRSSLKQYNRLRWVKHCAKVYRDAPRKLRKCEMRKIARRRQSERKRYI